jgi:hypothetical protein
MTRRENASEAHASGAILGSAARVAVTTGEKKMKNIKLGILIGIFSAVAMAQARATDGNEGGRSYYLRCSTNIYRAHSPSRDDIVPPQPVPGPGDVFTLTVDNLARIVMLSSEKGGWGTVDKGTLELQAEGAALTVKGEAVSLITRRNQVMGHNFYEGKLSAMDPSGKEIGEGVVCTAYEEL